jgi:GTP diphosphokinase / guanosine-3',5'-bis(diphosphate) 3'-diphosphatase
VASIHAGCRPCTGRAILCDGRLSPISKVTVLNAALMLRAICFAADKHRDQRRKDADGSPYINHPLAVAEVLARIGGIDDPVTLLAAVLHDTVEDTKTSFTELEELFGPEVRAVVAEVSDDKKLPKEERKRLQIEHAAGASGRAKAVKLADKICNVIDVTNSPPSDWPDTRRREYLDWSTRVVEGCRGTNAALERYFDERVAAAQKAIGEPRREASADATSRFNDWNASNVTLESKD